VATGLTRLNLVEQRTIARDLQMTIGCRRPQTQHIAIDIQTSHSPANREI
jgi:hypothetical protein